MKRFFELNNEEPFNLIPREKFFYKTVVMSEVLTAGFLASSVVLFSLSLLCGVSILPSIFLLSSSLITVFFGLGLNCFFLEPTRQKLKSFDAESHENINQEKKFI